MSSKNSLNLPLARSKSKSDAHLNRKNWWRFRWRITPLLTITMLLVVVVFITVITILDIRRTQSIFWGELELRGVLLASQLNDLIADPLYFVNIQEIDKVAGVIERQPGVEYVRVFTPDGRLIVDTSLDKFPVDVFVQGFALDAVQGRQTRTTSSSQRLEVASPVIIGQDVIGGVWFGLGSAALQAQIREIVVQHIWQGLVLMAIASGISYLVARHLTRPIRTLVWVTERMASGHMDARAEGVTEGELGDLAESFNKMADELEAKVQDLQVSRARLVAVQENVRREIASHLHGRVQGRLLALRGRVHLLASENGLPPESVEALEEISQQLEQISQDEISGLSRRLYPSILRRGLVPALQSLGDRFEATLNIDLNIDDQLTQEERQNRSLLPEQVKLAAYRITEDALTNVVKHAEASHVVISLAALSDQSLLLTVVDDGKGFDTSIAMNGLGMAAMQDYANAVGGESSVESSVGNGTTITATLPLAMPLLEHPAKT